MKRRQFLTNVVATLLSPIAAPAALGATPYPQGARRRVRLGDPDWPSRTEWNLLKGQVGGRLSLVTSPLAACGGDPQGDKCRDLFRQLRNPYYIGDEPGLTQTCGWLDAWTSEPSIYVVSARNAGDVSAAINFARENNLRLVVKGGGHSYLGTSNAPDSLLVWTRPMHDIVVHDSFVPQGCKSSGPPQAAVSVGAGAMWMHVYKEVTTKRGRYVQGGGCATVGVAGLVLGGGFGSYSKSYGIAAASLLEAEVVTADGLVRIVNACSNPDLFWALKGGGGGTFGVVTRVTLQTHDLPDWFGFVTVTIRSSSGAAFRRLITRFVDFYADRLHNPHWGEIANIRPGNILNIQMSSQGLTEGQLNELWKPFLDGVATDHELAFTAAPVIRAIPAAKRWDSDFIREHAPSAIRFDDRPAASVDNAYWTANVSEAGHYIYAYQSIWLPERLLNLHNRDRLVDALVAASGHSGVELHFQKGLAGGAEQARKAAEQTSINPLVREAFVLAIVGSEAPPAFPDIIGREPHVAEGRRQASKVNAAMAELLRLAPDGGCYVAESDYFLREWQSAYWGANYPRLLALKKMYDPECLFVVHHGVGSEEWGENGFTRSERLH